MIKFVWFLPVLQSWAGFLCMLTSHLQRFPLTPVRACIQNWSQAEGVYVWGAQSTGITVGQLGFAQCLVGELPNGVCNVVSRIHFSLMSSKSPCCSSPSSHTPQPRHEAHLNILDGAKKKWVFLAASYTAGKVRLPLTCSHFTPKEEITRQGLSWHWAVPLCSRVDTNKVKGFILSSSLHPISDFLLQQCAETSLLGLLKWVIVQISVLYRERW